MIKRFLDTSFLLALGFLNDENHDNAIHLYRSLPRDYLTTEYVLTEFLDATSGTKSRQLGLAAVDAIRSDRQIVVVPASTDLLEDGISLYRERGDKEWGVTDCISFIVMQRHSLSDAFTADRHFEQAGFRALLRCPP